MKLYSDLLAHGFALGIAIVTFALAVDPRQDVKARSLERPPQNQAVKASRQERKELKNDRRDRRINWRERRRERREGKPQRIVAG
jgi:hypothetical protein